MNEWTEVIRDGNTTFSSFRHTASTTDPRFTSRRPKVVAKRLVPSEYFFRGYDAVQSDMLHDVTSQKTAVLLRESSMCAIIFSVNFINAWTKQNTLLARHRGSLVEQLQFCGICLIQNTTRLLPSKLLCHSWRHSPLDCTWFNCNPTDGTTIYSAISTSFLHIYWIFTSCFKWNNRTVDYCFPHFFRTTIFHSIYCYLYFVLLSHFETFSSGYTYLLLPSAHSPPPQHGDVGCAPAGLAKSSNVLITLNSRLQVTWLLLSSCEYIG